MLTLEGKIALVTGASRGAGRGIAQELAMAGATVYITGRSRTGNSTTQYDDLTLDETQKIIQKDGGTAIPITCDHTNAEQIRRVFGQIKDDENRLDILVNNVWGGYTNEFGELNIDTPSFTGSFWEQPLWRYDKMFTASARAHFIASQLAAPLMIEQQSGLIVITSFWDSYKYLSNLPYDLVKTFKNRISFGMAIELKPHSVTALTLSLGWIRTEHLKREFNLDDFNYREQEGFEKTESTRFAGRAIVAFASDPNLIKHTGKIYTTAEVARIYDFTDLDGTQPEYYSIADKSAGLTQR
ncbi:MAG: SDR family NAD(P)-dependent oxidoreductase [Candidatus Heimdallarchaeota archaeon]|nr:SDR family NAD(P)-dependent oxidoreductase [Candidatus Heimdallarchaeota archaeon]